MTIRLFYKECCHELGSILHSQSEGEAAARIIFEDVAAYSPTFIFVNGDRDMLPDTASRIDAVIEKVRNGEPVQYAVGKAQFMGNDYTVTEDVLIPRPETAAMVDMITDDYAGRTDLDILDVGTGSGCIAISLAKALPFSHVTGIDISLKALNIARKNAKDLKVSVDFGQVDILNTTPGQKRYDIIVSNPPYITNDEKTQMDARVLDYEPASALFVPDNDPMLFYRAITKYALVALHGGRRLYFEINSRFPDEVCAELKAQGFEDVEAHKDYRGFYRYVTATKPNDL